MSPKSQARRRNGSLHARKGPIPFRYIKAQPKVEAPDEVGTVVENTTQDLNLEIPGLSEAVGEKPAPLYRPIFPQGPRDMTNRGKHHKYMVIPEFTEHHFKEHRAKKPDGTWGQKIRTVKIPLYTLFIKGKDYATGKKRGGPGGVKQFEAIPDEVSVPNA